MTYIQYIPQSWRKKQYLSTTKQ